MNSEDDNVYYSSIIRYKIRQEIEGNISVWEGSMKYAERVI